MVGLVLELLDEAIRLFLRYSICFQSPALHDLEDLEQGVSPAELEMPCQWVDLLREKASL